MKFTILAKTELFIVEVEDTKWNLHKVAGVKVYLRQTWNFRYHAVSACIGLWCHRPACTSQAYACMYCIHCCMTSQADACSSQAYACMYCIHCPMTSKADAYSYYMGSVVLILSWIYLYLQLLWISSYENKNFCSIPLSSVGNLGHQLKPVSCHLILWNFVCLNKVSFKFSCRICSKTKSRAIFEHKIALKFILFTIVQAYWTKFAN